ncbi:hypothetical protein NECAME_18853 [Necator americanus]|uniref:Uncharacterized protein n=1 Tax=Necator americanus TaxID=51031 RepID=W2SSF4_NECAM|nr:hypothetical protein NECAME_18853 [Necator americanus]ETN72438.1 hypothetical protein NECAME_18853 [Necator americanus]
MHPGDAQPHQQGTQGQAQVRQGRSRDQPQGEYRGSHRYQQRFHRQPQVVAQWNGQAEGQHAAKCIDQMPAPMATPPASSQRAAARRGCEADTREAISSAVNEARIATRIDSTTNNGL